MMLTYVEPDDSIFTNNSTRQDRGRKIYPKDYYFEYLYMGDVLQKPEFLDAANEIMAAVDRHGLKAMDCLIQFMLRPSGRAGARGQRFPGGLPQILQGQRDRTLPPEGVFLHHHQPQRGLFVFPERRFYCEYAHRRQFL